MIVNSSTITNILHYTGTSDDASGTYSKTVTIDKSGCLLIRASTGSVFENFYLGSNTNVSCTVKKNGVVQSCQYSKFNRRVISSDGNDRENWAEKDFYYCLNVEKDDAITISIKPACILSSYIFSVFLME